MASSDKPRISEAAARRFQKKLLAFTLLLSNAEREHFITILTAAVPEGRMLTKREFSERPRPRRDAADWNVGGIGYQMLVTIGSYAAYAVATAGGAAGWLAGGGTLETVPWQEIKEESLKDFGPN